MVLQTQEQRARRCTEKVVGGEGVAVLPGLRLEVREDRVAFLPRGDEDGATGTLGVGVGEGLGRGLHEFGSCG